MHRIAARFAAAAALGYAAVHAVEAVRDLRAPGEPVAADARLYGRMRRRSLIVRLARELAMRLGTADLVAPRLDAALGDRAGARAQALLVTTFVTWLVDLPVAYVEDHVRERRFALTDQTARDWLADHAKASAIALGTSVILLEIAAAVIERAPRNWPLLATAGVFPFLVVTQLLVPAWIAPLFNSFEPLEGELAGRLRALAARLGVADARIYRFDMSRQTRKANAYVTGVLGTHRIVLGDTMLDGFGADEITFVAAHELGHYVARDTWRSIVAGTLATAVLLAAAAKAAPPAQAGRVRFTDLARMLAVAELVGMLLIPVLAATSRSRERAADRFALAATADPAGGIGAFARLRDRNLAEAEQPRWMELLFASHPSLKSRIETLERASAT